MIHNVNCSNKSDRKLPEAFNPMIKRRQAPVDPKAKVRGMAEMLGIDPPEEQD